MKLGPLLKITAGILVSAVFIWLIAASIPVDDLMSALTLVRPGMLAAGVGFFILGYSFRISRWHLMLKAENPALPYRRAIMPFMISIAANNVLPLRAGDVMRAFMFKNSLSVPSSGVLATLVAERLMDLVTLLFILGLTLAFLGLSPDTTGTILGVGSAALIGIAAFAVLVIGFPQIFRPPVMHVLRRLASFAGASGERLLRAVDNVFDTMQRLVRSGRTLGLVAMSLLAWSAEMMVFVCSILAIPSITHPEAALLAMPVGTLSTLLPASPGYLGTFHYFVIEAARLLGNLPAASAAFAIVVHLVLWLTATVIGGVCFVVWTALAVRN